MSPLSKEEVREELYNMAKKFFARPPSRHTPTELEALLYECYLIGKAEELRRCESIRTHSERAMGEVLREREHAVRCAGNLSRNAEYLLNQTRVMHGELEAARAGESAALEEVALLRERCARLLELGQESFERLTGLLPHQGRGSPEICKLGLELATIRRDHED